MSKLLNALNEGKYSVTDQRNPLEKMLLILVDNDIDFDAVLETQPERLGTLDQYELINEVIEAARKYPEFTCIYLEEQETAYWFDGNSQDVLARLTALVKDAGIAPELL